jgi:hypothetical protein
MMPQESEEAVLRAEVDRLQVQIGGLRELVAELLMKNQHLREAQGPAFTSISDKKSQGKESHDKEGHRDQEDDHGGHRPNGTLESMVEPILYYDASACGVDDQGNLAASAVMARWSWLIRNGSFGAKG